MGDQCSNLLETRRPVGIISGRCTLLERFLVLQWLIKSFFHCTLTVKRDATNSTVAAPTSDLWITTRFRGWRLPSSLTTVDDPNLKFFLLFPVELWLQKSIFKQDKVIEGPESGTSLQNGDESITLALNHGTSTVVLLHCSSCTWSRARKRRNRIWFLRGFKKLLKLAEVLKSRMALLTHRPEGVTHGTWLSKITIAGTPMR